MPGVIEGLLGLYNVRDAGAKGDGQTNDTPRVHDAILALPPSGGTVVFPPGNYFLGSNVTFQGRTNVTLWLLAGASFSGPGALPANAGTNRVFDMSFVSGSFPPSGPAGGTLSGNYPNPAIAAPPAPTTQAFGDAAAAGATGTAADSAHRHGMPANATNANLATDVARLTLLVNGGLEVWQRGNGPFATNGGFAADRWTLAIVGTDTLSVSRDTTHQDAGSATCAACTFVLGTGAGGTTFYQKLEEAVQLRGRTITASVRVWTATAGAVRVQIGNQTAAQASSAFHTGNGTYQTLTVSYTVAAGDTSIVVGVYFAASTTAYVDNVTLVIGAVAMDYAPLTPADDLARCLRYYQRWAPGGTPGVLAAGQAFSTTGAIIPLQLQAKMGGVPTLTFSAAADWQVSNAALTLTALSALAAYGSNTSSNFAVIATASAAVLVAGNGTLLVAANANASIALEWNP
jgi:hypothetical protein